ncbi:hypothetical protein LIA77_06788 [Sarocladium implicatum]|nr:hypothetical protein LIA77_06788 [Sarocladium implicatum]
MIRDTAGNGQYSGRKMIIQSSSPLSYREKFMRGSSLYELAVILDSTTHKCFRPRRWKWGHTVRERR